MIEWLRRQPGLSPFLITDDRSWSYAETLAEVEARLASEPVVIRPKLDPESVFAILAGISGPGATLVPPLVGGPPGRSPGEGGTERSEVAGPDRSTGYGVRGTEPGSARLVVYTSGTSGSPKGVRLTLGNLEAASLASMEHLGHGSGDTWLLAMPLHHVGGLSILIRSAVAGGSVYLTPGFDPQTAAEAMRGRVSMVSMVSTMLIRMLDHVPGRYQGLRAVLIGGGPVPEGLVERAWEAGIPALVSYGMTETFGQVATALPQSGRRHRAYPLPGVEIRIESDGRIAVAGDQVSPGYLAEPDREDRWLVTNDLGEIGPDGSLRVLGRADTVIVSGGENVDPTRIERVLEGHPLAGEVLVVGVPDPEWGMAVCCLYTGEATVDQLVSWLRERVPGSMVPKRWRRVDRIPVTGLGKPDRAEAVSLCRGDPG